MRYQILFFMAASALFIACRPSEPSQRSPKQGPEEELGDFYGFYQKFHQDSAFQMDHIMFPIEGLPPFADAATIAEGNFRWYPEDWVIQRPVDYENSDFQRELISLSEDMVVEKIKHRNGQVGMMRRFVKMGDEWYLIYFADLNRIK